MARPGIDRAIRLGFPVALFVYYAVLAPVEVTRLPMVFLPLLALGALTALLTPGSRTLTRRAGYAAAVLLVVDIVVDVVQKVQADWFDGFLYNQPHYIQVLYDAGFAVVIAAYVYREITTRRARPVR
ncbi:hypothetical protein [Streptomyces sp. NPDC097981]|uniref:hypothetical protein n=1 Tax=Streptomyces sp. NPDC097981 TaxID=3155428 RepID=UPI00332BFCA3